MRDAPVQHDVLDLCALLMPEVEEATGRALLAEALGASALRLLDDVTLAAAGREREAHLAAADEELLLLRARLELAAGVGGVDEGLLVDLAGRADAIGRQIGGWVRSLRRHTTGGSETC
ncbi:MAG: hypothetical protein AAF628_00625 [Planctomycetota bacterium]